MAAGAEDTQLEAPQQAAGLPLAAAATRMLVASPCMSGMRRAAPLTGRRRQHQLRGAARLPRDLVTPRRAVAAHGARQRDELDAQRWAGRVKHHLARCTARTHAWSAMLVALVLVLVLVVHRCCCCTPVLPA